MYHQSSANEGQEHDFKRLIDPYVWIVAKQEETFWESRFFHFYFLMMVQSITFCEIKKKKISFRKTQKSS